MGNLDYKQFTERRRPHLQPLEAILFVTFRLADSIPRSTVRYYKAKRDWLRDQLKRVEIIADVEPSIERQKWLEQIENLNREWFIKCEEILHRERSGPTWLRDERIASTVATNLHRLDGDAYRLDASSVMSNHVHTVFKPLVAASVLERIARGDFASLTEVPALAKMMQSIKGRSSRECNLLLGRSGSFWEHENFDHVIRSGRFEKTIRYVLNNPVKIGTVQHWQDWQWNYCRNELIDRFV